MAKTDRSNNTPLEKVELERPAPSSSKLMRKRVVRSVLKSRAATEIAGSLAHGFMRLVHRTNPLVKGSDDIAEAIDGHLPVIVAYWHGQHIFAPLLRPKGLPMVALLSKNSDAELNATLLRKVGVDAIRGSGGRDTAQKLERGGARALIQLKRKLDEGISVNMIADISKSEPRFAGAGIVTLAKISGRPILPLAFATSRRKVIEKSWDKTTINLPFGKGAVALGPLIYVEKNANETDIGLARNALTSALNEATLRANTLVGIAQHPSESVQSQQEPKL